MSYTHVPQSTQDHHAFDAILAHQRSQYSTDDWRYALYAPELWRRARLRRTFTARKQGVTLPNGVVVAFQVVERPGEQPYHLILHPKLRMPTSLPADYLREEPK